MAFKTRININFAKGFMALAALLVSVALPVTQAQAGSWPGGNGRIAAGSFVLETMNPDGSDKQPVLTSGITLSWAPDYSPDGTKLAFTSTRDNGIGNDNDVFVINADGTGLTNLTAGSGAENQVPAWSPDGSQIAFLSDRGGTPGIYTMNADGSNVTPLGVTVPLIAAGRPPALHWSPDGSKLLFHNLTTNDMMSVNADGTGLTNLSTTFGLTGSEISPVWSPDGSQIAFYSFGGSGGAATDGLYYINANGTGLTLVTPLSGTTTDVVGLYWSPDGSRLVYSDETSPTTAGLFTINVDGTDVQDLNVEYDQTSVPVGTGLGVAWQPLITPSTPPATPPATPGTPAAPTGNLADTGTNQQLLVTLAVVLIAIPAVSTFRHKILSMRKR